MTYNGGFTLGGKTANELGIIMTRSSQRPMLAPTVDRLLSIPGRNGQWDFGADLGARMFGLECVILPQRYADLQISIDRLAMHLLDAFGRPRTMQLILDASPDRFYSVRYSGDLPIERLASMGQFTLPLLAADPHAYSLTGSDGVILDSYIPLDSYIRLDDAWSFAVNGAGAYEVNNWGGLAIFPEIIIAGSATTISISTNGKTFIYSDLTGTLTVDGNRMTVKKDGVNVMVGMTGDFLHLLPGINEVTISGVGLNCQVSFNFKSKYA